MPHLVGSVGWNSNHWRGAPEPADHLATGHANVRAGYIGNECLNLAMDPTTIIDGWKLGAIEKFHRKTRFIDGGLVFMWSRSPAWRNARIIGVLAGVHRLPEPLRRDTSVGPLEFNLCLPAVPGLALLFNEAVEVKRERHLHEGSTIKQGPGQACGCYIDDAAATNILSDAAGTDPAARALLELRGWGTGPPGA